MQTFLPYSDIYKCAKVLDYKRLGKQRVETYQILNVLLNKAKRTKTGKMAWQNHPAVLMWKGYEKYLCKYGMIMCIEWKQRGYKDSLLNKLTDYYNELKNLNEVIPNFIGNEKFHESHKSNLLRKNKEFYSKYFNDISDSLEYIWPIKKEL